MAGALYMLKSTTKIMNGIIKLVIAQKTIKCYPFRSHQTYIHYSTLDSNGTDIKINFTYLHFGAVFIFASVSLEFINLLSFCGEKRASDVFLFVWTSVKYRAASPW